MQAVVAMYSQIQTIKVESLNGKKEDYPKWALKQKQHFNMADMGHVLDKIFSEKLPGRENTDLDDSLAKHKAWANYWQYNTKAGVAIVGAQESEDIILALQEATELERTCQVGLSKTCGRNLRMFSRRTMNVLKCW